jgi:hypothetical protein
MISSVGDLDVSLSTLKDGIGVTTHQVMLKNNLVAQIVLRSVLKVCVLFAQNAQNAQIAQNASIQARQMIQVGRRILIVVMEQNVVRKCVLLLTQKEEKHPLHHHVSME